MPLPGGSGSFCRALVKQIPQKPGFTRSCFACDSYCAVTVTVNLTVAPGYKNFTLGFVSYSVEVWSMDRIKNEDNNVV